MKNAVRGFISTLSDFPFGVKILLICAIGRAISVFTLLPFLPIYLNNQLGLNIDQVGYALGVCLLFGTLSSVYGGYLADKFNKYYFILSLVILMSILFFTLSFIHNIVLVILFLILINTASSSMSVTISALFADLLPEDKRSVAFSIRYSLENIGTAIGPFFGAWLVHYDMRWPFWLSGVMETCIFTLLFITRKKSCTGNKSKKNKPELLSFSKTMRVLRLDKRLVLFTLGGILAMTVYGPLLTYLAQYLVMLKSPQSAYEIVAYVAAVNASIVICLQYLVGSSIKNEKLLGWLTYGMIAFVVGLMILSLPMQIFTWVLAIAIFTIGEIIIVPAEYMFIDSISPSNLKGIYFGAQNLIFLGMAIGPIFCGFILRTFTPHFMFYALIGVTVLSWIFYFLGCRINAATIQDAEANHQAIESSSSS